jgi:signal transduction histidine kinase
MNRICSEWRFAVLASMFMLAPAAGAAEPPVRQVLMLQSFNRGSLILDHFTGEFRVELDQRAGKAVNVVQMLVGPTGFVGAPEQAVVEYIRSTYAGRPPPDLIVTVAGPAAVFARKYHAQLFPDTPLLFAAVDYRYLQGAPLGEHESAVSASNDFPGLIDDILQVLPETRQVFVVIGAGVVSNFWRQQLETGFERFRDRLTFIWSGDLSLHEILSRCAHLPDKSAIFYLTFGTDASGTAYADERVLAELHARSNAPLFAAHSPYFGAGIVGGRLISMDDLARKTANSAVRILNGEPASSVRVPSQLPGRPLFDWRELQRWGIAESRLPAGSEVRFRRPSLWSEYRTVVLVVAGALAIQAILIVGLLFERRARLRAEIESRKNLTLAADTSRRVTMSALTGSIAHEISQPLSAMIYNAEALQLMINASRATPENISEILADIHADGILAAEIIERHRAMLRSRKMEKKQVDLQAVVSDTLALVAHDILERQIEVTVDLPANSCRIHGDPVLLEQVLVNLVINAMDAMQATPRGQRHITISSEARRNEVEVVVHDTGPGLPADLLGRLFTPFVTTKSHGVGIGLAIARTIVEAHGGRIGARNSPVGGAIFTLTLPTSDAHEVLPAPPAVVDTVSEP